MVQIDKLKNLNTPCFVLEIQELERCINGFQKALASNFGRSVVGYSVKTNSTPYCMVRAREMGAFAEVVSYDEYNLAKICGFPDSQIIYNGPMKDKSTFFQSVCNEAIVNIETKRELEWLKELPQDKVYPIGIRLNINISHVSPEDADGENDNSRFGFSTETNEFADALEYIVSLPNVRLAGLHIHRTAHSRSLRFYEKSIEFACQIIKQYNLCLDYLDIGGGYFGIFPNKPTFEEYSSCFYRVLSEYGMSQLRVIVEPGNALVASCFAFVCEVIDTKQVENGHWFITTDGSRNDIDPFFRKQGYWDEEVCNQKSPTVELQTVAGCTCLEYDRLFELRNKPLLNVGDRIIFNNVGAYTMCLSPMFIRYIPNIYMENEGKFELIRDKWTAKEYIQKSIY